MLAASAAAAPPRRSSSATAARAAIGPSTRSRPTASPRRWAPTSSSRTSSRRRTACSSRATRTRSAERPTSRDRFPDRKRTKTIDGQSITGWFTEDFTLAEIKTLRAKERLAFRSHDYDGQFQVPTFDEVIELAQQLGRELGRPIGVYPETKHPTYFRGIGLPLEEQLLASLEKHGWNRRDAPVFIQSFEQANLRELRRQDEGPADSAGRHGAAGRRRAAEGHRHLRRRHRPGEAADRSGQARRLGRAADRPGGARARARPAGARLDAAHRQGVPAGRLQGTREEEFERSATPASTAFHRLPRRRGRRSTAPLSRNMGSLPDGSLHGVYAKTARAQVKIGSTQRRDSQCLRKSFAAAVTPGSSPSGTLERPAGRCGTNRTTGC